MAVLTRTALAAKINNVITANNNRAITGAVLNDLLQDVVDSLLNISSDNVAFQKMTTTQRNAIVSPVPMIIYNTTTNTFDAYTIGIGWASIDINA
jgi:hypothetical protein